MLSMLWQGTGVRLLTLDWSDINTSGYDRVPQRVFDAINSEVSFQRAGGVAATRVDFFGHSMGGVIVKWYASDIIVGEQPRRWLFPDINWNWDPIQHQPCVTCQFVRANNFGVGDVRRLVTVGSPFRGSPIADEVASLGYIVVSAGVAAFATGDGTAVDDLGTGSAVSTQILNGTHPSVPWFPIVALGASLTPPTPPHRTGSEMFPGGHIVQWSIDRLLGLVYGTDPTDFSFFDTLGLHADDSDFAVGKPSQMDRVSGGGTPAHWGQVNARIHTDETASSAVADDVKAVLDLKYTDPPNHVPGYTWFNSSF